MILTDPALLHICPLGCNNIIKRKIAELGIYPAVDPLDSTSRILTPSVDCGCSLKCAQRVKFYIANVIKSLQDIIAILGWTS